MIRKFIAGGCSFTLGNELSDDTDGKTPSQKTWAYGCYKHKKAVGEKFVNTASGGIGNPAIARRVFSELAKSDFKNISCVVVMWSFLSRYDWAMPRNSDLEGTRWASISPWDTNSRREERHNALVGSEVQREIWARRDAKMLESGVRPFADALYRYAANEYHETYLSWKSISWLQNILTKHKIPFMFTLADNSLFYRENDHHKDQDGFMRAMHNEIDFTKWFSFGERMMGFNQWAKLNDYEYATTHPLDKAHEDAIMLMKPTFLKITGGK